MGGCGQRMSLNAVGIAGDMGNDLSKTGREFRKNEIIFTKKQAK